MYVMKIKTNFYAFYPRIKNDWVENVYKQILT